MPTMVELHEIVLYPGHTVFVRTMGGLDVYIHCDDTCRLTFSNESAASGNTKNRIDVQEAMPDGTWRDVTQENG